MNMTRKLIDSILDVGCNRCLGKNCLYFEKKYISVIVPTYLFLITTMDYIIFWNFILAIALGALIGTEREMPRTGARVGGAAGFGGIRSYALLSLLGAIATWMDLSMGTNIWKVSGLLIS